MLANPSSDIHSLAELFAYLAQNPTELEAFKASPATYLRDHAIELPADDLALFFSGPTTVFKFLDNAHDKQNIEMDPVNKVVLISPRDFDVHTEDETFSGNTIGKGDKLELRFLDDNVVYIFSVDYQFTGENDGIITVPSQTTDVYPFYQKEPIKGVTQGFLDKNGGFEINLDLTQSD